MPLQSDIVTALSSVAGGRVYPQVAPQNAPLPLVVYRIANKSPLGTLNGTTGDIQSAVVFECWAESYSEALSTADAVVSAIDGAATLTSYRDSSAGEDYEPAIDAFVEPVYYGFWHT
jgi:hypothetical protein